MGRAYECIGGVLAADLNGIAGHARRTRAGAHRAREGCCARPRSGWRRAAATARPDQLGTPAWDRRSRFVFLDEITGRPVCPGVLAHDPKSSRLTGCNPQRLTTARADGFTKSFR